MKQLIVLLLIISPLINSNKPDYLKKLLSKTPMINLPYKAEFEGDFKYDNRFRYYELGTSFTANLTGDVYIQGLLPDTSNYYYFIYAFVAANSNPAILTLDKKGNYIDHKVLTEDRCAIMAGEIINCEEYVIIDKNLKLEYKFDLKIVYDKGIDQYDTVTESSNCSGLIDKESNIKL